MTNRRKCGRRKSDYIIRYLFVTSFIAHVILGAMIVTGCPSALGTTIPLDVPGDKEITAPGGTVTIPVTSLVIEPVTLKVGQSQLAVTKILPADASDRRISYSIDDTDIAELTSGSVIFGKAVGTTTITVTSRAGEKTSTARITVETGEPEYIAVNSIAVSPKTLELAVGQSKSLAAAVEPVDATYGAPIWISEDNGIATVNPMTGEVTGIKPGTAEIRATAGGISDTCTVNVLSIPGTGLVLKDASYLSSDNLSGTTITLHVGETKTIYADVTPAEATNGAVKWTSSDSNLVSTGTPLLPSGSWLRQEVTIRAGSTPATEVTISAHVDGVTPDKTFTVNVIPGVADGIVLKDDQSLTSDNLTGTMIDMYVGETKTVYADVTPSTTINGTVTWTSANPSQVATTTPVLPPGSWLNQAVTIMAGSTPTSTPVAITAHIEGGVPDKTFHVNVLPIPGIPAAGLVLRDAPVPLGSDTLSGITIDLHVGETKIIYADVMPSNTTHGEVQWTSANTSLVSMGTPLLQAGSWLRQEVTIRAGSTPTTGVTISAHVDGVTPDKTFTVNVLPGAADGIALKAVSGAPSTDTITGTMIHLQVGETKKIYADVTPSNTINGAVTMTSADGDKVTVTLTGPTPAAPWTDQEWTITGKALTTSTGPVIITANAGGGTPDKTFFVQVQPIPVTDITGVPTTVTVGVPLTLSGTVEPADATYRTIAWSITNAGTTGATISGDTANTTAPGDYTVTGTISNGLEIGTPYTKSFPVSVLPIPVSSVTVAPLMLGIGESSALSADVQPANATYRTVTWTSETPGVATVNPGTGEVTGVAQGTAVIRATADGQSGTCTVAVVPLLPYAQVVEGPASGNGLSVVGFRDWHYVLEWKREPTGIPLDANYDTTVVIPALEAALVTWNEYSKRIDPLPYYESSSRRVYDVIFSSSHDLDNGGGKQIVLNRYWPEFADDTVTPVTNRTTWLASENTRKAAFKKAVAEMKAMMAVIEKSPLYTAGDLSNPLFTLYSQMDEFTKYDPDPSDEEFEQRFIFTEANVSPTYCKAEVDSNLDYPDKSSPLYEYYLGCVPDIDGYVDPYGPFAFPGTGP